ncbi:MAG TPA: prolipoprotein diacylglyceryl transferase [Methylophilaceae bacterium]|nr:prolipoprotein diacylglyceryl transferase [Methylophilaceae bacterium]
MFTHPQFDPVAIHITEKFGIHWYGLMYLTGFLAFLLLGRHQIKSKPWFNWNYQMLDDALFYGALGVILGGRLGYALFYQFSHFIAQPLEIVKVWQGGMSFHGGFLGVLVAMYFFHKKHPHPWLTIMDFIAPLVPIGLGAGRIGNFINGELWGRPTNSEYGMIFPQVDLIPRHPSQLYEFALEGLLMFSILWWFSRKQRSVGSISALFLILYGTFRFTVEFTRQPDDFLGLLELGLSMGQWLSLPMIVAGIWMYWAAQKKLFN